MLKWVTLTWAIANFGVVGLVSWLAGGWYIGWPVHPVARGLAELILIMLPNLLLPLLVLRYVRPGSAGSLRMALGWRWAGWRSLIAGLAAFAVFFLLLETMLARLGSSIPYNLPGATGEGIAVRSPSDLLLVLGVVLGLVGFVTFTVAAEETMFRGWIQSQFGQRYGPWAGIVAGALLFGLRHLPADLFYAQVWHATPQMWLSRQAQLYSLGLALGLACYFGRSTFASAITHTLVFVVALFGLG